MAERDLTGKVAFVTGASAGIGAAVARRFAERGVKLGLASRRGDDLGLEEVVAGPCDVRDYGRLEELIRATAERFGGIDILVANAGGPPRGYFEDMTDEQWQGAFEVSLLSVVRLVRGVLPSMKARRWGRILTIQSVSVKQPIPELLLSNAVRPGVAGMMKTLAGQLGKDGITVNTVCPGKIMTDRFLGGQKLSGLPREEFLARAVEDVPVRRIGTPEEFAAVVVFLASERASYVTGVAVQVDGGLVRGLL